MKRIELLPTKENIYQTYIDDSIGRDKDICDFISLLEMSDGGESFAINSDWGSGKTFFVKQIKMILEAYNTFVNSDYNSDYKKEKVQDKFRQVCDELEISEIKKNYLPIYYDAWKYDNDDDPVLSIVFEIILTLDNKWDFDETKINFKELINGVAEIFKMSGLTHIFDSIKKDASLNDIIKSRDLKSKIDEFLNQLTYERADRVVIFIDELDRCRPTYAVKLLERIKHYFSNDKIIFVFSTNLEELQSSVKCVYGENFNAYRYLDRFFDLKIPLPGADMTNYFRLIDFKKGNNFFDAVCHRFIERYNFQLRDIAKYARYLKVTVYNSAHNDSRWYTDYEVGTYFCLNFLAPIIVGLFIYDITLYNDFINGKNSTPLIDLLGDGEIGKFLFEKLLYGVKADDNIEEIRKSRLNELYDALFNTNYNAYLYEKHIGDICVDADTKKYLNGIINFLSQIAK